MKFQDKLLKRIGLFLLVYIGLVLLFQVEALRQGHLVYYCKVGDNFFNIVNPNYYAEFTPEAPENENDWNTTIAIYGEDKHNGKVGNKAYRKTVNPDRLFYRNLYELVLLPTIFLMALFIVTPGVNWKRKLLFFVICIMILYLFLSFHYSHIFENLVMNNGEIGDSLWQKFVGIFGFRGLTEPLYLIALVSWAALCFSKDMADYIK